MQSVLAIAAIFAGFALVLLGIAWVGRRAARQGVGASMMGIFDEIYHPAAHEPHIEIHQQAERKQPSPVPGDPPPA